MNTGKFVKNEKYYRGTVYEWNLQTGTTCPFALECKVTVDRAIDNNDDWARVPHVNFALLDNFKHKKKAPVVI